MSLITRDYFETLRDRILGDRKPGEHLFLSLAAEDSQFIRVNGAKIRQIGTVDDASLDIALVLEGKDGLRRASRSCTVTGLSWKDLEEAKQALAILRAEAAELPIDPYAQLPIAGEGSSASTAGSLPDRETAAERLVAGAEGLDIAGIYGGGPVVRAMANSAGQTHWFATETFGFDYSIYTPGQRAIKGTYAGSRWDDAAYRKALESARGQLEALQRPARKVERGAYRTYLAPAAVSDLVAMLSWGAIGEAAIRQGDSPLRRMRTGERRFSPRFSLAEDFTAGDTPRFNSLGELAPERLPLFEAGELRNTLVSSRTSREYGVPSTGAAGHEGMRAPVMAAGDLAEADVLRRLGTGLYLSNLHYLNWSDQPGGRITGMTRYACFWVENGRIDAPIENMRWDDSLFRLFGTELEAVTREREYQPDVMTYERRAVGGMLVPGALLSSMNFTL